MKVSATPLMCADRSRAVKSKVLPCRPPSTVDDSAHFLLLRTAPLTAEELRGAAVAAEERTVMCSQLVFKYRGILQ